MNMKILLPLVIVLVVIAAGVWWWRGPSVSPTNTNSMTETRLTDDEGGSDAKMDDEGSMVGGDAVASNDDTMMDDQVMMEGDLITKAEVAQHDQPDDCWVVIDRGVYDLSNFNQLHPGGAKPIEMNCGGDGSVIFNNRGEMGPHPESAREALAEMQIGVVATVE